MLSISLRPTLRRRGPRSRARADGETGSRPSSPSPPPLTLHSVAARYGAAAALAGAAYALESRRTDFFQPAHYLLFYPCAYIAAVLGGMGPAFLNILLAATGAHAIFYGAAAPGPEVLSRTACFIGFAGFGCWLIGRGRRAEAFLRDSEAGLRIFRALADNSTDFIGIADPRGTPVYVNPAGRALVDLPADLPVAQTRIAEYYPPDVRAFASDVILKEMREKGHWKGETFFRNFRTEERIPVWDEHFLIHDSASGRLLGMGTITRDYSDRLSIQEELRRSRERLSLALEGAGLGAWDWDMATGEVVFNRGWAAMRGFTPEEVAPHVDSWRDGIHPDDRPGVEKALAEHLAGRTDRYEAVHRARTKAGTWIWVLDRGTVISRDAHGRPVRMAGTEMDITERKRGDAELQRLRDRSRFLAALDAAAGATIIVDRPGSITYLNDEAERVTGWTRGELLGRGLETLIPERYRAVHRGHHERFFGESVAKRPMGAGRELWLLRKDGDEVPVEIGLARVQDADEPIVVVSIADITLRKAAEAALRDSEERFRLLVNSTVEYAIFMHDPAGAVSVWSEGAERILGYRADAILHRDFRRFYLPEDVAAKKPEEELRLALTKGSMETEGWRVRADGSRFRANIVISPIRDSTGRLLGFGKVIRDLTEREKAEHALRESEARLRQSVDELEGFAYTISHDLRSPIRAIEGYSHLLTQRLAGRLDPESTSMLERVRAAAVRLDHLIRDLLSYAAIRHESVELSTVDLDSLVSYVVSHYLEVAKAKPRVKAPLGVARAQESLMIQVLSNLLTNAAKFTPPGRAPEIDVWAERASGKVRLFVKDNGIGIPRESRERVFSPFARLNPSGAYEGTGMGLAIAKRAVRHMGGVISFESEPGRGSRFCVELQEA